ncbi:MULTISPECIES: hypothetical protein [unclassified Curtobacterium]|uniref:hypothetical protein n=1 Tax=unclassified Curtobacterium TaxID=257496 RepID=UPI0021AC242B|nr:MULTISPECIES: hypothetical protein [unclassified Curtobacterium]WIE79236.1 hypothetical protein DEJ19_001355 [Curtobacterium sp. MCSS17_016]
MDHSAAGRVLDAQLHLLDRQVQDPTGEPVMTVDDIELDADDLRDVIGGEAQPRVVALLTGPVLGTRIFGGRPPRSRFESVPWHDITDIGITVTTSRQAEEYDLTWHERWFRQHVVGRIPGGRHAPQ